MTDEGPATPSFQMHRVFPDVPSPPRDTPIPPNHDQFRKDDPEESLLGSFIQWVQTNKKKSVKKQKNEAVSPNQHRADQGDTMKKTQSEENNDNDDKQPNVPKRRDETERNQLKAKSDHHGDSFRQITTNPMLKDVHLSRLATPKSRDPSDIRTYDPNRDKCRVMYLTVRLEQQLEHVRHVLKTMAIHKAEKFRINSMVKVKDALALYKSQLLGIHANSVAAMKMFSTRADLEEFFGAIDTACGSVGEVPLEGCCQGADLTHVMKMGLLGRNKDFTDEKSRIGKSKTSPPNNKDVINLFKREGMCHDQCTATCDTSKGMDGKKVISREKIQSHNNGRRRINQESEDGDNGGTSFTRRKHINEDADVQRRGSRQRRPESHKTTGNPPSERNTDGDNDVVIHKRRVDATTRNKCKEATSSDVSDKNDNVTSTENKSVKSAAEARRRLYRNDRSGQGKGRYPCPEIVDSWSDTDSEEEDLLADNGADWPLINAKQLEIRQKEQEFNSLMDDIDALMARTVIKNGQPTIPGMSFEELMMGQCGGVGDRKNDGQSWYKPAVIASDQRRYGSTENGKKNRNTSDEFIEELEELLNECESVK